MASLADKNTQLLAENHRIKTQVLLLQEQHTIALAKRYAASSERRSPDQIRLFSEADAPTDVGTNESAASVTIAEHLRQKRGRKSLSDHLPHIDVIHELPEAERYCVHDGAPLVAMGTVISEQLDIIPATIRMLRHIRTQYACRFGHCLKTAPLSAQEPGFPGLAGCTSPSRSIRMSCRCTGRSRFCSVSAWTFRAPRWRTERSRPAR